MERLTERTKSGKLYLTPEPETDIYGNFTEKGFEQLDAIYRRLAAYEDTGLSPDEIQGREDYIAGVEVIVQKFRERMDQINNIAVGWQEDGPYEDANAKALEKMMEIEKLSRLPQPPKEES